ncbi:MAG TPA: N-6 DNA methylase [Pirellulales bacterium]|nr:N-6 DNA methylase [Pirellulales bacterium]
MTKRKATGAHFTPPDPARLIAERVAALMSGLKGPIRVLDPACGDGNLLRAIHDALPREVRRRMTLIGIENDHASFASLQARQSSFDTGRIDLIRGDFLEFFGDNDLFGSHEELEPVDCIIANPPYVRTQVLGANRAQQLAARFGLSGRVDLYQAFLVAMARQLRPGGILGVITSNRFLTTRGGMATRRFLRTKFDLLEIVDLGDTKLFEAAVLPALVFARKRGDATEANGTDGPSFVRIYEATSDGNGDAEQVASLVDSLRQPQPGLVRVNGCRYRIATGNLPLGHDDTKPWTLLTGGEADWVAMVDAAARCRLGEVAKVRVGIKTTADGVFIRRDWETLPGEIRPDPQHLRALLSQEDTAKWRPLEAAGPQRRVLYTHEVVDGRRRGVRFSASSPTWKYLLSRKENLESRKYVLDAGRAWYEIWVPQDPQAWSLPKIVFPDISPDARFFWDVKGSLVDGNCYWITTNDPDDEELLLFILGVANAALISRYHDLAFQNKLYSQRRRHLTQYITEYPLPDRDAAPSRQVVKVVRRLVQETLSSEERQRLEARVDALVAQAFGIDWPDVTGRAASSTAPAGEHALHHHLVENRRFGA